ncbi:hypothetical protein WICANDRAFT_31003 [Wickerhamomyces anomalus NRRL Y-366-8]|uniref:Restriction of telomere capping protein 5 n=1 Tax=Wickerhamomyces anomalus (strain ATCC 58044 / CBS 1984 / NCYC 433 / NRRL Y-366-8) TaxID=683960 RepID=A0A1E3P4V0_WICAA|nr:uncharacterized protein WICANDRAFT_31003 [Wickerhamomyces anomalus NRRL Y-366-8]ODQ60244.1 hypothetical protein WICANDRAFT_31003 [Wickerhamomyces anomalus NRRL Y-366-8]
MGQSSSVSAPSASSRTVTNDELLKLFSRSCRRQFLPIELLSIGNNMKKHDKDHNELISEIEFQELLGLPDNNQRLLELVYNGVKKLSNFPLINSGSQGINYEGLLKSIVLLHPERYGKLLTKDYDYLKLVFIIFAIDGQSQNKEKFETQPDTQSISYLNGNSISWKDTPAIQNFDDVDISTSHIRASDALELISFLLVISRLEPQEPLKVYSESFKHFDQFKENALSILRSMNSQITLKNLSSSLITFDQFSAGIENVAPNLLHPLSNLLEILLYDTTLTHNDENQENEALNRKVIKVTSRLINDHFLAQLSTFLPKQLVYSNIRKLYAGSDSGFSMRSFESKVFKWNAPTILLVSGTRINEKTTKNTRYKNFETEFHKLKAEPLDFQNDGDKITYGVYIAQPWRITNKETFGDSHTEIFQLSPIQKIFKPSISAKHFTYFNTLGGGIGIGSIQPTIKGNNKTYNPGNVSLTIDSTLEFAVFRHLGLGGEFRNTNNDELGLEYEDRFLIKNVEVWGCGGEKELAEQNKQWEWEQQEAKRRQNVNLKSIGEDRAILEMAGLVGQHQSGGSM